MEPATSSAQGSVVGVRLHIAKLFALTQISTRETWLGKARNSGSSKVALRLMAKREVRSGLSSKRPLRRKNVVF
jgi:hypothetical protein